MYPQWCTMYSYDHIVCWVIILGLTCRVEIPRLGICFITVLTRLCLSTLVLVNARGVNPILVIYSISICQWSVVHPRWSWTDSGPNRNGDLEIRLLSLRVFRHLDNSNTYYTNYYRLPPLFFLSPKGKLVFNCGNIFFSDVFVCYVSSCVGFFHCPSWVWFRLVYLINWRLWNNDRLTKVVSSDRAQEECSGSRTEDDRYTYANPLQGLPQCDSRSSVDEWWSAI